MAHDLSAFLLLLMSSLFFLLRSYSLLLTVRLNVFAHAVGKDFKQDGRSREPGERAGGRHDQPKGTPGRGVIEARENGGETS